MGQQSGQAERSFPQRRPGNDGIVLPRSQRLRHRVCFENAESELAKTFDAAVIARGVATYLRGGVSGIDKVGGRGNYHVRVDRVGGGYCYGLLEIRPKAEGVAVDGVCTCEIGRRCEHLAAAALTALAPLRAPSTLPATTDPRPNFAEWLESTDPARVERRKPRATKQIVYLCSAGRENISDLVRVATVAIDAAGRYGMPKYYDAFSLSNNSASYVSVGDQGIGFELARLRTIREPSLEAQARNSHDLMRRIVETGRAHLGDLDGPRLCLGPPRGGTIVWREHADGLRDLHVDAGGDCGLTMCGIAPWYFLADGTCGPIDCGVPLDILLAAVTLPKIAPAELAHARFALSQLVGSETICAVADCEVIDVRLVPEPRLRISRQGSGTKADYDVQIDFRYADRWISADDATPEWRRAAGERTIQILHRNPQSEAIALERLRVAGFMHHRDLAIAGPQLALASSSLSRAAYAALGADGIAQLRSEGWIVESVVPGPGSA